MPAKHPIAKFQRRGDGFTMVEILIALSIIVLALSAVIGQSNQHIRAAEILRDKTFATWVGEDKIKELMFNADLQKQWPEIGTKTETVKMGNIEWYVEINTSEIPGDATIAQNLRRIEVTVSTERDSGKVATLFALISNPN